MGPSAGSGAGLSLRPGWVTGGSVVPLGWGRPQPLRGLGRCFRPLKRGGLDRRGGLGRGKPVQAEVGPFWAGLLPH